MNLLGHRIRLLDSGILDTIPEIVKHLENGQRILVVCNTVKQAQTVFEQLQPIATNPQLLHSRFILRDRERIEKELSGGRSAPLGHKLSKFRLILTLMCYFPNLHQLMH